MAAETTEPPSSPSPSTSPMKIDGSERDAALASSEWLSRREVLERRARRAKQLSRVYRQHYWAMMEDVKAKHREYYWIYGKSPFKDDQNRENGNGNQELGLGLNGPNSNGNGNGNANGVGGDDIPRCQMTGCKTKAMALTKFCHTHILSDPNQKLYKGCTYVIKSMLTGLLLCSKPILRSTVPCLCPTHFQKGEKCLIRNLRKAGLNVSSLNNLSPEFHFLISEYVSQIRTKRRPARKNNVCKLEPK